MALGLSLALGAAVARAQTTTKGPLSIRLASATGSDPYSFSADFCSATPYVQWTYDGSLGFSFTTALSLWATSANACGTTPGATDLVFDSVASSVVTLTRSGQFQIAIANLPGFSTSSADAGASVACGDKGVTVTQRLCGAISYQAYVGATATVYQADDLVLVYDAKPPTAPRIASISGFDGTAAVTFAVDGDTTSIASQYRRTGESVWRVGPKTATGTVSTIKVTGLTNGQRYDLQLFAIDVAGNVSEGSAIMSVIPTHTAGFYENVVDGGSGEKGGGCATAGASASAWPLAAVLIVLALSMHKRASGDKLR